MSNTRNKQKAAAVRAAFIRQTPERGYEHYRRREPMTDEQLRAWSDEQAGKHGVHVAAKEAAARGRTLMVFIQGVNQSLPYEQYEKFLEAGGYANRDEAFDVATSRPEEDIPEIPPALGEVATEHARAA